MALSEYDQQFAEAMALKLKLNRAQRSTASEASSQNNEPSAPSEGQSFRSSILEQTAKRHPGLTPEDLDLAAEEMRKMGF